MHFKCFSYKILTINHESVNSLHKNEHAFLSNSQRLFFCYWFCKTTKNTTSIKCGVIVALTKSYYVCFTFAYITSQKNIINQLLLIEGVFQRLEPGLRVSFLPPASKRIKAVLPKAPSLHLHPSPSPSRAFQLGYLPFFCNISSNFRENR